MLRRLTTAMNILKLSIIAIAIATTQSLVAQKVLPDDEPKVAEQKRPAIRFQTIESRTVHLGDHSVLMNRVISPVLPEPPVRIKAEVIEGVEEEVQPQKRHQVLFLSTTVYDRKVTEIRWSEGARTFAVFSNIDFNYFTGIGSFETADTQYMLILGLGNETSGQVEAFNKNAAEQGWAEEYWKQRPPFERFSPKRSEYVISESKAASAPSDEQLSALDALHGYFDANKQQLMDNYAKRQALNEERARRAKEHPPVPKDTVINFWMEETKRGATTEGRAKP